MSPTIFQIILTLASFAAAIASKIRLHCVWGQPVSSTTESIHLLSTALNVPEGRVCELPPVARRTAGRTVGLIGAFSPAQMMEQRRPARLAIKIKGRILLLDAADVIAVEAKGSYILLLHTTNSHRMRGSISSMEEKLASQGFVRIHRSVLVNAALVEEIQPSSAGDYTLRLQGGREYTVTRSYKKNLRLLARSWIGMSGFATE